MLSHYHLDCLEMHCCSTCLHYYLEHRCCLLLEPHSVFINIDYLIFLEVYLECVPVGPAPPSQIASFEFSLV